MNASLFAVILTGVMLNAGAQLFIKYGTTKLGGFDASNGYISLAVAVIFQPQIFMGLLSYVISVALWIYALSKVEVSVAYPMLSIGYIVNAGAAWYLFGEQLTAMKMGGIFLIVCGVVMIGRS